VPEHRFGIAFHLNLTPSLHGAGLKRHFHAKHAEGLLSSRGLRSLDWCCDSALDEPDTPLDLWERVEAEVRLCRSRRAHAPADAVKLSSQVA
jgi:hypothetical protein